MLPSLCPAARLPLRALLLLLLLLPPLLQGCAHHAARCQQAAAAAVGLACGDVHGLQFGDILLDCVAAASKGKGNQAGW